MDHFEETQKSNWFRWMVLVTICLSPLCMIAIAVFLGWPRTQPESAAFVPSQPARINVERVSGIRTRFDESFVCLAVRGEYAYAIQGSPDPLDSLRIVDISDPANPEIIGSCPISDLARTLDATEDVLCVLDEQCLRVIDVSQPMHPREVGSCELGTGLLDVEIEGTLAYVTDASRLRIIDLDELSAPKQVGECEAKGAQGISVTGGYAYIASRMEGMLVVDISVPTSPTKVAAFRDPRGATDVDVVGNFAYVAGSTNALWIVDISNPRDPMLVGRYGDWNGTDVVADGGYAFVGGDIVDVSEPTTPVRLGGYPGSRAVIVDNYLYTFNIDGFSILRLPVK